MVLTFRIAILLFSIFISMSARGNGGYEIEANIQGYEHSQLILGFHYNGKQLVKDTAEVNDQGTFIFSGEEALKPGVYMVILLPDNNYFELLVDEDDQHFQVRTTAEQPTENLTFSNSTNNEVFSRYLRYIQKKNQEARAIQALSPQIGKDSVAHRLQKMGVAIRSYQRKAIADHSKTLAASLIRGAMEIDIPEFSGSEAQIQQQRYDYYKDHYFDHIDLADPRLIRSPLLRPRVEKYFDQLIYQIPDSINVAVDRIIKRASGHPETFKYWVTQFLNKYADLSTQYVGFDAVYVHIALNYYCSSDSRVDWIEADMRNKICKDARKFKAVLIGNRAPRVRFQDQQEQWLDLYEVDADFTILYFYKPDCSYCEASIPKTNAFIEARQDPRIKIISVCNQRGENVPKCWETVREMKMENWINVTDPYAQGLSKFKVESFPTIFILDKDKKIISKGIGSEQLDEIINLYQQTNE